MNKVFEGFCTSLNAEKEALSLIGSDIKIENVELPSSVVLWIEKLQADLTIENKIMDELAEKNQKTKVLAQKLKHTTQHNANLEEERSLIKGCISEVNQYLTRIVETRKSSFTVSIRQSLSKKLQLVFAMLNHIISVSGSRASAKQRGDKEEKIKKGKDKGKGIPEDDNNENTKMTESERIAMEMRDKELDELNALKKKFEAEEAKDKNVKLELETHKSLFRPWFQERIQREAIEDSNIYWLEPTNSFDLKNDV